MQRLLVPVKEKALQAAIKEAKQEAESTTINTLTAQIMAQQAQDQKGLTVYYTSCTCTCRYPYCDLCG